MPTDRSEEAGGSDVLDERVREFEAAWKVSPPADLRQFVSLGATLSVRGLSLLLISIDQEFRWQGGRAASRSALRCGMARTGRKSQCPDRIT